MNDLRAAVPVVGSFDRTAWCYSAAILLLSPLGALGLADLENGLAEISLRCARLSQQTWKRCGRHWHLPLPSLFELAAVSAILAGRERREQQLALDAQQGIAATFPARMCSSCLGPPGSGKTLVLAGRAKYLAAQHPDWHIVVLCYNNSLVPYLKSLVGGHPNIAVATFGKFSPRWAIGSRLTTPNRR